MSADHGYRDGFENERIRCSSCSGNAEACSCSNGLRWVNAYLVDRCYGGPEEGGWWFDSGESIATVPMSPGTSEADAEREVERLRRIFSDEGSDRDRSSVLGGPNLEVWIEDHQGRDFPEARPHYE